MNPKRVIFAACSLPIWADVASALQSEAGWEPVYWVGRSQMEGLVRRRFPNAMFHDHAEAIWCRRPNSIGDLDQPVLEASLIEKLAVVESLTLRMMDRIDYAELLSTTERRELYYEHVRYWSAILDRYQPDLLFNVSTPHQIYDFVLQELCRLRKIPTLMFGLGFDLNLIFCKDDYTQGSGSVGRAYRARLLGGGSLPATLHPNVEKHLARVADNYDRAMPLYLVKQYDAERRQPAALSFKRLAAAALDCLRGAAGILNNRLSGGPEAAKLVEARKRKMKERLFADLIGPLSLARLRRYYRGLATEADLSQKYIYVPLTYQPEQSSSPEGHLYADQLLVIDMLSRAAPPGWSIFVKEHPSQFTYLMGTNRSARSYRFYDQLVARPNVRLLALSANPFALIDNAHAVATISGTSGWEALVRGKPALHFGYPWWQGCEGTFHITDLASCRSALDRIQQGYRVETGKVRLFAQVAQECGCSGDLFWKSDLAGLSSSENTRVAEIVREMVSLIVTHERNSLPAAKSSDERVRE